MFGCFWSLGVRYYSFLAMIVPKMVVSGRVGMFLMVWVRYGLFSIYISDRMAAARHGTEGTQLFGTARPGIIWHGTAGMARPGTAIF